MDKKVVLGVGELLWDVLESGRRMGGAPANFVHYVGEHGCEGHVVSAVGRDASGDDLLADVASVGIGTTYVQRNDFPTSTVDVVLDDKGVPAYCIHENVAWDNILPDERTVELARRADAICWGSLAQRSERSRETILALVDAMGEDALRVFDINLRQSYYDEQTLVASLKRANVLKLNDDELETLTEMFDLGEEDDETRLHMLLKRFDLRYIVYTMGVYGSIIVGSEGEHSYIPTPEVEVADTVGAGDSFTATFVALLLQGRPLAECHGMAVGVAAYVCTQHGAIAPLPKRG